PPRRGASSSAPISARRSPKAERPACAWPPSSREMCVRKPTDRSPWAFSFPRAKTPGLPPGTCGTPNAEPRLVPAFHAALRVPNAARRRSSMAAAAWCPFIFAHPIGGVNHDKGTEIYKFEKIKRAKRKALADRPERKLLDFGIGENDDMADANVRDAL